MTSGPRVLAACLVAAGVGCAAGSRGAIVERADVRLNLLLDGSLEVRETLTVSSGSATSFVRDIPHDRVDDFIDISAWIGDRRLPPGEGSGHVKVTQGTSMGVRWQFAASPSGPQTFTLQYRATGVLALDGTRGELIWDARPADLGEAIGPTHIELTAPSQAVFDVPPSVVERGWTISRQSDRWIADKAAIGARESVTIAAALAGGSLALAQPAWQYRAGRARELMPAFIACGPFLFVVGFGVLFLLRLQYPPMRAEAGADASVDDALMMPGLASAVSGARFASWRVMQATVAGLMRQGVVQVAADAASGATSRVVTVRQAAGLRQHEQLVADELWLAARDGRLDLADAIRALRRVRPSRLRQSVATDLLALRWMDPDRAAAARGLYVTGVVVAALGVVLLALSPLAIGTFGIWLLVIPGSFLGVGVLFVTAASRFPRLTAAGSRIRAGARTRNVELARMKRCLEPPARRS